MKHKFRQTFNPKRFFHLISASLTRFQSKHKTERLNFGVFDVLPSEIILHILFFLDLRSIGKISRVSREMQDFVKTETLWRSLCWRDFGALECSADSWQKTYKSHGLWIWKFSTPGALLSEDKKKFTKTKGHTCYQMVIANVCLSSGSYYWECEVTRFPCLISAFMCFGVINSKKVLEQTHSGGMGFIGETDHGWGWYADGDRVHGGRRINFPPGDMMSENDVIGIYVIFTKQNVADVYFYKNKQQVLNKHTNLGFGFKDVTGPLWPAATAMREGTTIQLRMGDINNIPFPKPIDENCNLFKKRNG